MEGVVAPDQLESFIVSDRGNESASYMATARVATTIHESR